MLDGDTDDAVRRWNDAEDRWELVEAGEQLPGPSKDDLYFVKTPAADDGLYTFNGTDWVVQTDITLTGTVDELPGAVVNGNWYLLTTEKDGKPAASRCRARRAGSRRARSRCRSVRTCRSTSGRRSTSAAPTC
jgi:hypothetical protein